MVDDCTHFYGNSRRAGFHDPCGFVTDTQTQITLDQLAK